jgi:hypothetical protein
LAQKGFKVSCELKNKVDRSLPLLQRAADLGFYVMVLVGMISFHLLQMLVKTVEVHAGKSIGATSSQPWPEWRPAPSPVPSAIAIVARRTDRIYRPKYTFRYRLQQPNQPF